MNLSILMVSVEEGKGEGEQVNEQRERECHLIDWECVPAADVHHNKCSLYISMRRHRYCLINDCKVRRGSCLYVFRGC